MKPAALALSAALVTAAHADEGHLRLSLLKAYQQECAACHVAYPPSLLPAASWKRLMNNLPQHFGTDASLDPAAVKTISGWLEANASKRAAEPPQDRITRSAWFQREHDEVPRDAWQRPSVRNAANCAACHTGASEGDYSERRVRVPR
ncbi:MAG TPA: diheme cytochrome c [Burkholderiaceae bacterium]|nr:diheme cytochrome c [Burkholderiaceae bacterium]